MRFVIQRVHQASVRINNQETASIGSGLLILMGIHQTDTHEQCAPWIEKILKLRIFPDENKPINRSIQDINGELLVVSQFTLYADCKGQNRPSFIKAAKPPQAQSIYDHFVALLKEKWQKTQTGTFGAMMDLSLINHGPVTIILEDNNTT